MDSTQQVPFRVLALAILIPLVVITDQATKSLARHLLLDGADVAFLLKAIHFKLIYNKGIFLGLGRDWPHFLRIILFTFGQILCGLVLLYLAWTSKAISKKTFLTTVLVAAGDLSNPVDHILNHGAVTDFIQIKLGPLITGVFNLADLMVVSGLIMVIIFCYKDLPLLLFGDNYFAKK